MLAKRGDIFAHRGNSGAMPRSKSGKCMPRKVQGDYSEPVSKQRDHVTPAVRGRTGPVEQQDLRPAACDLNMPIMRGAGDALGDFVQWPRRQIAVPVHNAQDSSERRTLFDRAAAFARGSAR